MNNPDPLEMQGHIDAMRIVLGLLIAEVPLEARSRIAKQARADGDEFQTGRIPQMTHPTYMKAFGDLLRELA